MRRPSRRRACGPSPGCFGTPCCAATGPAPQARVCSGSLATTPRRRHVFPPPTFPHLPPCAAVAATVLGAGRSLSADGRDESRFDPLDRHLDALELVRQESSVHTGTESHVPRSARLLDQSRGVCVSHRRSAPSRASLQVLETARALAPNGVDPGSTVRTTHAPTHPAPPCRSPPSPLQHLTTPLRAPGGPAAGTAAAAEGIRGPLCPGGPLLRADHVLRGAHSTPPRRTPPRQ